MSTLIESFRNAVYEKLVEIGSIIVFSYDDIDCKTFHKGI